MAMKKKILLMGRSGCGKTSMRALIFSSALYPNPSSTRRLGTTLGVETSHFRFLKNLVISLFDMGGQQAYMDSYLDDRKGQLFKDVGAFVYVFDMGSVDHHDDDDQGWEGDFRYWRECLRLLHQHSPSAQVISLLHKMDLVDSSRRKDVYLDRARQLTSKAAELGVHNLRCCGTSIWDESLYRAWSQIIHSLIPNISALEKTLDEFVGITGATEAVIFEKTTFLVIASSSASATQTAGSEKDPHISDEEAALLKGYPSTESQRQALLKAGKMHPDRFEKISELVKNLRGTCQKLTAAVGVGVGPGAGSSSSAAGPGGGATGAPDDDDDDPNIAPGVVSSSSTTGGITAVDGGISSHNKAEDDVRVASESKPPPTTTTASSSSGGGGSGSGLGSSAFQSFEIKGANFSAYLDWFTSNTYILVIVADQRVQLEAVKLNVQLGRERFEKLS